MELTGLKYAINTGTVKKASSLNNTESNSRTLEYKQIKNASQNANLPKFDNGLVSPFQIMTQNGLGSTQNEVSAITQGTTNSNTFGGVTDPYSINPNLNATPQKNVQLNSSSKGSGIGVSGVGNVVTSGIQFAGDAINSFSVNETGDEIAKRQGTSDMSIGGIGYESPNMINLNEELERVKKENTGNTLKTVGSGAALGAAAGSIIPGLGTVAGGLIGGAVGLITGIFGGEARKREYRRMLAKQNAKINALQDSARYSAQTKAIQLQNAREYGNSEAQYLYGAADGKVDSSFITPDAYFQTYYAPEIKEYNKNKLTYSALGPVNAEPNAKVSRGEIIANKFLGTMYRVPGGKDNKDTEYAYLSNSDTVVTNKGGESDRAFATGDIRQSEINMMNRNKKQGLMMAKNGKLPKCKEGWVGNAITSGLGALGGLYQWLEAKNSTPKKTNSYRANPYEQEALTTLASLDINPYPITTQLRNAEARSNKAIDMSGGLSTGQRTLSRLAALHNTQQNIANTLASLQNQRNQYKSSYATAALNAGQADRQAQMAAYQWDEDMYAKAHAARQQGMQMGTWNMLNQLQQYWANEFKRQQFNEAMDLYKQDQKLRKDEIQSLLNGNSSLAKNMYNYTKKRMGDYMIGKAATNPMFNPTKATTYKNLTGKWLAGYNFNQKPSIPYIKTN